MTPQGAAPPVHPVRIGRRPVRRSLYVWGALALGILLAHSLPPVDSGVWFGAALTALGTVAALRGRRGSAAALACVVLAGAGWYTLRIHERPTADLVRRLGPAAVEAESAPLLLTVEGVVATAPIAARPQRGALVGFSRQDESTRFQIRLTHLVRADATPEPASGVLTVFVDEPWAQAPRPAAHVRLTGRYSPEREALNPGGVDPALLARQAGRVGTLVVPDRTLVFPGSVPLSPLQRAEALRLRALGALRARGAAALDAAAPPESTRRETRSLLRALLLGERDPGSHELDASLTRLGLVHMLAISGFHLGALAGAVMLAVRLTGDRGRLEPLLVVCAVVLYMLLVPAKAPVLRAGTVLLAYAGAEAAGRRYDRLTLLGWVGVALLLWRPLDALNIGYQLTFGVVAALIWLGPSMRSRLFREPIRTDLDTPRTRHAINDWMRTLVAASVLAWLVASPAVAAHAGLVSPLAPLASILALPFVMVLLIGGYLALLVGAIVPPAAPWAGAALAWVGDAFLGLVAWIDSLPLSSINTGPVSGAWAAVATVGIAIVIRRGWRPFRRTCAVGAVLVVWLIAWRALQPGSAIMGPALRIDTLAVGDGACHVLRSGGDAVLYDCGSLQLGLGEFELPRALRAVGVDAVSLAVISHPNLDHYSLLPDIARAIGLERVLVSPWFMQAVQSRPEGPEALTHALLTDQGIRFETVVAGDAVRFGRATMEFLSPDPRHPYRAANDTSLVARVGVRAGLVERTALLTGDIQREAMALLLGADDDGTVALRADVLELPHHGSAHEAAYAFVARVDPGIVLQSTGPSRFGDVRWDPYRPGRIWWTTAADGAAWVEFGRDGSLRTGAFRGRSAPR